MSCKCRSFRPHWREIEGKEIAANKPLDACENCGVVVTNDKLSYANRSAPKSEKPERGFGDKVADVLESSGLTLFVETLTDAVGIEDCGCTDRISTLNKIGNII